MEKQKSAASRLDAFIMENTPARTADRYRSLVAYAETHDFGILDEDVVVIDTETTGFSFNHDELIQIAAARMVKGEIREWYVTFVNPEKSIPDEVAHLTDIHDEDVADAPDPDEALKGLVAFVGDSYVVAHNAQFDRTFTTKRPAGEALKNNIWVDSLDLARIAFPRLKSHRLLDLVRAFGGPDSTHRADEDVAATCLVYRVLLAGVATMPKPLVAYIANLMPIEEWNTAFVFKSFADEEAPEYNVRAARRACIGKSSEPQRIDPNRPIPPQFDEPQEGGSCEGDAPALEFATPEDIKAAFSEEGAMGGLYADYEPRDEQREMALAVNKALSTSRNLVVEAGTGVGKSMAYLVPLALAAKKNGITVGVATKTNVLLDQLVHKELPLLSDELGITYSALKGFTHYPCMRKVENLANQGAHVIDYKKQEVNQAPPLAALLSYIDQTDYDDMDALKIDYRAIPRKRITTSGMECLRRKCPYYGRSCFVHGAREQAQRCDVVVTNHSLLFWDVRFEGGLLPPIRYWVVDEAHGAEAEARRSFSIEVSTAGLQRLARVLTDESSSRNVLTRVQRSVLAQDNGQTLYDALISTARTCSGAFAVAAEEFCLGAKDLLVYDSQPKSRGYSFFELWLNEEIRHGDAYRGVVSRAQAVYDALEKLIKALRDIVAYAEEREETSSAQRELALVALELRELYDALDEVFFKESTNYVYSARLNRAKGIVDEEFLVQPLDMGASLNKTFYIDTQSVIYTSATLSVDGSFSSFEAAMGLNQGEESRCDSLQVDSSFDFDSNMKIYVPTDMPEPQDRAYLPSLQTFLRELHLAQHGSLLTLFTNRREMEACFEAVLPFLKEADLRLVCQKWGVSIKGLRDDFLKDEHLSLFALKSFWEGFDAPGSTLKGVVVPKLPFGLPTDPLSCERQSRDDRAWSHYSLPAAVIDVKQAVGRLIRKADDKGIVVLADHRLISKGYGRKFLNSLPSRNISFLTCAEIVEEVAALQAANGEND